jgi:hypothetical protein
VKKIATAATIEDARASPAGSNLYDGQDERLLTTPEAASDLRVSKSYLDKLRVYGGARSSSASASAKFCTASPISTSGPASAVSG